MKQLSHIEATTLANWLMYSPQLENADQQAGTTDGGKEIPKEGDEHRFFTRVMMAAKADFSAFQDQVEILQRGLKQHADNLQHQTEEVFRTDLETKKQIRERDIEELQKKLGPTSTAMINLSQKAAEAKSRAQAMERDLGRPLRIHFRFFYLPIMGLLAVMEVPINRFAFELYFAETPAISFFVALGIGVILMLLAHFGGMWVKRYAGQSNWYDRAGHIAGVVLVLALILPTVWLIASLRQHYIQFVQSQQITFTEFLQQSALSDVAQQAMSTELGAEGWMLLFINILVVGLGTLASVLRHDSDPDFETAVRQRERLERQIEKWERRYQGRQKRIEAKHERKIAATERTQSKNKDSLQAIRAKCDACASRVNQMPPRVAVQVVRRVQAYEAANELTRSTQSPKTFGRTNSSEVEKQLADIVDTASDALVKPDGIHVIS